VINSLPYITAFVLALAASAISITVTKAKICKTLRERIMTRNTWFGELVSCPYCFSFWVSLAMVLVYQPVLVTPRFIIFDLAVSVFAIMAVASILSGLIMQVMAFAPSNPSHADDPEARRKNKLALLEREQSGEKIYR
jgi:hypothetical protein